MVYIYSRVLFSFSFQVAVENLIPMKKDDYQVKMWEQESLLQSVPRLEMSGTSEMSVNVTSEATNSNSKHLEKMF